jgi:hypothetical protein
MRRELVIVIFGREQVRAGQKRRAPVAGGILETMGGGHGEGPAGPVSVARRDWRRFIGRGLVPVLPGGGMPGSCGSFPPVLDVARFVLPPLAAAGGG